MPLVLLAGGLPRRNVADMLSVCCQSIYSVVTGWIHHQLAVKRRYRNSPPPTLTQLTTKQRNKSRERERVRQVTQERTSRRKTNFRHRTKPLGQQQRVVASPSAEENHFVCFIFRSRTPRYIEFKLLGCNSVTDRCIRKIEKRRVDFFISLVFPLQKEEKNFVSPFCLIQFG